MEKFLEKPKTAIERVLKANSDLANKLRTATPSHELPKSRLDAIGNICDQVPTCLAALSQSLFLIEETSLDVVDMETRMQGESGKLAHLLADLGDEIRAQHFINKLLEDQLVALEEGANVLAAALYPSGVQGLNKVNSKLWEFSRLQMSIFRRTLERISETLSAKQRTVIESKFAALAEPFDGLNEFLNELALRALDGTSIEERFRFSQGNLEKAQSTARETLKQPGFSEFKSVLKASISIAADLQDLLRSVHVPMFPLHSELQELRGCVSEELYSNLTGLETFALLNIGSRLRSIKLNGAHMLSPDFGIEVFDVFPDRIYFHANESLLQAIQGSKDTFSAADASLHKFREGSFKQRTFGKGNLQVSHTAVRNGKIDVDADIDLYRDPAHHLFGEVLVNHLSGQKTDAYKVRSILDEQRVDPIGGFHVFQV